MSLINDALKRAQEDKDRGGPPPLPALSPTLSPVLGDEPEPQVAAAPRPGSRIPLRVILLVAVLVAGGGWCAVHFKKKVPGAVSACCMSPLVHHAAQPTTNPTVQASVPKTVQAAALPTTTQPAASPTAQATANATTQPALQAAALKIAASQPVAAAITRSRVRVVAPPPGGLDLPPSTTQPAALPFAANAAANEPDDSDMPADVRIQLPNMSDNTPGPATAAHHSATSAPAAKSTAATQPAAKPVASAADVAQQFHVSCIMFSDQGSTAIINGSPVKVGATIRAEGTPKAGLPEEAVVKRIDRNCVQVELGGEKYLLRI
jgi:hypothetical protein